MCLLLNCSNVLNQDDNVVGGNPLKTRVPMVVPLKMLWMQQQKHEKMCTVKCL